MMNDAIYGYDDDDDDEPFSYYEGPCAACETYAALYDLMLCQPCGEKLERDFMRQREWDHSATAFGLTLEGREEVRRLIIQEYGEKLELLADPPSRKAKRKSQK